MAVLPMVTGGCPLRIHAAKSLAVVLAVGIVGCGPDAEPAPGGDQASAESEDAPMESGLPHPVERRLFSIEGLQSPEAVKYDPELDRYVISNFGEERGGGVNDGFLALASAEDGELLELRWATGPDEAPLQDPLGMALQGDTLWVVDADGLHAFHRQSGSWLDFVDLTATDPGFLNDVDVGPDGAIYVTDTGASRLVRVRDGRGEVLLEGEALGSPNGITWIEDSGAFVLVPWESGGDSLRSYDPTTDELGILARSPGGRFDGVEVSGEVLVVASQADSALHVVQGEDGFAWQKVPGNPADIAVDTRRNRVAVPYIAMDRVDVFPGRDDGGP